MRIQYSAAGATTQAFVYNTKSNGYLRPDASIDKLDDIAEDVPGRLALLFDRDVGYSVAAETDTPDSPPLRIMNGRGASMVANAASPNGTSTLAVAGFENSAVTVSLVNALSIDRMVAFVPGASNVTSVGLHVGPLDGSDAGDGGGEATHNCGVVAADEDGGLLTGRITPDGTPSLRLRALRRDRRHGHGVRPHRHEQRREPILRFQARAMRRRPVRNSARLMRDVEAAFWALRVDSASARLAYFRIATS